MRRWVATVGLVVALGGCGSETAGGPAAAPEAAPDAGDAALPTDDGSEPAPPDTSVADAAPDVPETGGAPDIAEAPDGDPPGDSEADGEGDSADADAWVAPPPPDYVTCDAGDEAWVKRTLPLLLGRRPHGMREVRVLTQLVAGSSRAAVARGLMRSPEFVERWAAWFMDELRINRVGDKTHASCYGAPMLPADRGQVAAFVRARGPRTGGLGATFNMSDVLRSALWLDDVSPIYLSHLFAMMAKPITGANVEALEMDIARRQDFGQIFESTYLHRNVVCAGCHNSAWSTTDHPDPAKDRSWPVPGFFEQAIYGQHTGRPEMEVFSAFRHLGVVTEGSGVRPWEMDASCGTLVPADAIDDDPAGFEAFFVDALGLRASVWDVASALRKGFDSLRQSGALAVDPETFAVDRYEAFAYLVSMRVVIRVFRAVTGYPLTIVNYFPRNIHQRDLLLELTNHFVMEQFSLRTLLADILTHPLYNDNAPVDGCGEAAYPFPPILNPWVDLEVEPEARNVNGPGDMMHRHDARLLLHMISQSLQWPEHLAFPYPEQEEFQKAVGVFVKDAEPGFDGVDFQGLLAWEDRYGACLRQGASDWMRTWGRCNWTPS